MQSLKLPGQAEMASGKVNQPLEILWAPWRIEYILTLDKPSQCIFCIKDSPADDEENLVLCRYATCFAMLNRYPYNNGHILVAPYKHTADMEGLADEELLEIVKLLRECRAALTECMKPDGFNMGLNLGSAAGAGIQGHLHFHIVPRWHADTNFMTVTGGAKVIPQALDEVHEMLSEVLGRRRR